MICEKTGPLGTRLASHVDAPLGFDRLAASAAQANRMAEMRDDASQARP
jgi:hypothetical protein